MIDTLNYIITKYNIDLSNPSPFEINIGRRKDFPRLLNELGYKVGAEIGVYQGQYAHWLLRMMPGLKLYGVDLWEPYTGYKDFEANDIVDAYQIAVDNVAGKDCTLIKGWSNKIVEQFEDESLDFCYIDGSHCYEYVVEDIAKWSKKVRKGGIVSGHDFDDFTDSKKRWSYMHVKIAVEGWMTAYKIHPWFVLNKNSGRSWFYVK